MQKKTITFFTNCSLESPSAIGRFFPLAKELAKKGFKINYLALHHDLKSVTKRRFIQDGVHIFYVGQMHVLKRNNQKIYFNKIQLLKVVITSTFKMIFTALSLKSDILYCFKPQPINGFAAFIIKIIHRKPFFLDCDDYEAEINKLTKFQKIIFKFFEDKLPLLALKVTYHSEFLKERYCQLGYNKEKFIHLSNGVDHNRFDDLQQEKIKNLQQELNPNNSQVVLYFGSLSLSSGHAIDLLLEAFILIKKALPHSLLLIIGGGEDIEFLKNQVDASIKDSVKFIGRIHPEEMPYYINQAHVTVNPVRDIPANYGRSPLKMFESMALGVPVVTSNIGDVSRIIENGKTGILVKAGESTDLAKGILTILSNKALSKEISQNCQQHIQKYYWHNMVERLIFQLF